MAPLLPEWPDAEDVVMALLESVAPTVTSTPNDLTDPIIRVQRAGGADDYITDYPRVEVMCFAPDRSQAWQMAERCRQIILAARNTQVTTNKGQTCLIDTTDTVTPAAQTPYPNPDVRRVTALYEFSWRRPRNS